MGRNVPRKGAASQETATQNTNPHDKDVAMKAPIRGGSLGVIPEAIAVIPTGGGNIVGSAKRSGDPGPEPRRYRVLRGGPVMYSGCRTEVKTDKLLDDTQYDIALLQRQGIQLEELPPERKPVAETVEEFLADDAEDGDQEQGQASA